MDESSGLRVECHAGYRADEWPLRFFLGDQRVEVSAVLDCWLGPDHRYFKVRADSGDIYILRHDTAVDRWNLTMFDRARGTGTPRE